MNAPLLVGIDLGTTHVALSHCSLEEPTPRSWAVPQLVAPGQWEARPLLPSFLYVAHPAEPALGLPWDTERRFCVGEHARARAVEAPNRVVSSSKSWLCHEGVDRRGGLLPLGAPEDVERVSPVEAAWRLLDHLTEAWRHERGDELGRHEIVLTVPASFDAAARELTVEAALAAGLENLTLLEEPQAALYAWVQSQGDAWRRLLAPGDVVLVVDVGGGTTDFSLIAVREQDGALGLERVAVGDHILLGGDNMDLALAALVRRGFPGGGAQLDRHQFAGLGHACRRAKEQLLVPNAPERVTVAVAGRGAQLVGNLLRGELSRQDAQRLILDGFFPTVEAGARPASRPRSALTQVGLPYAADAAVTRHLASFLARHAPTAEGRALIHPTAVLLNGGVMHSPLVRRRLMETLDAWLLADGGRPARLLPGDDPDLAVARGAAVYGLVRRGHGLRIRGGTARAYYVGIESPMPAIPGLEPPLDALCVAPLGAEEGSEPTTLDAPLGVVVGEAVRFRFFGSTVRREDGVGTVVPDAPSPELEELAPVEVALTASERQPGEVVTVRLRAQVTAVGTLELKALPLDPRRPDEEWKVELAVRGQPAQATDAEELELDFAELLPEEPTP